MTKSEVIGRGLSRFERATRVWFHRSQVDCL